MSDNQLIKILAMLYRAYCRGDIDERTWSDLTAKARAVYNGAG